MGVLFWLCTVLAFGTTAVAQNPADELAQWAAAPLGKPCAELPPGILLQHHLPSIYSDDVGRLDHPSGVYCDPEGLVAGLWLRVQINPAPATAKVLAAERRESRYADHVVSLDGERLWIYKVSCGTCRAIRATLFVGDLPRLSAAQLTVVQQSAGIPPRPLLRSGADWKRYCLEAALPRP